MSLIVWLPLNGNINNQGLSGISLNANSTPVYNDAGKIGKCYSTTTFLYNDNFTELSNGIFSVAYWVKYTSFPQYNEYCISLNNSSSSDYMFMLGVQTTSGLLSVNATSSGTKLALNQWYHIIYTYDGSIGTLYLDGAKIKTWNNPACNKTATHLTINGRYGSRPLHSGSYLNDMRIYDHCLSLKEIQELSRGLVCHYTLNNGNTGLPNLITSIASGGRTTLIDKYNLEANYGENKDTYFYFNVSPALELNKTYTISFDVENFPENTSWGWYLFKQNTAAYLYYINSNGHYKWTFETDPATLPDDYSLSRIIADDGGRGSNPLGIVRLSNFKLEEGEKDTPWCPHSADTNYSGYFNNLTAEKDCSGYSYNATKAGDFTYSTDTPRNNCCTVFNGTNTDITLPIKNLMNNLLNSQCTINFWCKEGNTASRSVYFGGYNNSLFNIEMVNSQLRVYWQGSPDIYASSISNNVWAMWTITIDINTGIKIYKNSQLVYTHSNALSALTCNGDFWLGRDYRTGDTIFEGAMSDFRIYATLLDAEAIKELYQIPATIDKSGNLHGITYREFNEKQEIHKRGIIDCSLWESYQNFQALKNTITLNENLFKNSNSFALTGSDYSSVSTRTLGKVVVSSDSVGNAYNWIHGSIEGGMDSIFNSTKTMILSIDIKVENVTNANASGRIEIDYRKSDHSARIVSNQNLIFDGKWHRYTLPITSNNNGQTMSLLCLAGFSNLNGATIYYKNIKFEEGTIGTPWCPSASEDFSTDTDTSRAFIMANQFYEV